jgi:tRNA (guanine-N7-)-methyltransferase
MMVGLEGVLRVRIVSSIKRDIKSFVKREGRLTRSQKQAIVLHGKDFCLDQKKCENNNFHVAFRSDAALVLDIGFGTGESLFQQVQAYPQYDFLGIEVYRTGIGRILHQTLEANIRNLKLIHHDAVEVIDAWLPSEVVDFIQIHFPDPWQKRRHHKRRLIQDAFLKKLTRILKPQGQIRVATDWQPYAKHIESVIVASTDFCVLEKSEAALRFDLPRPMTKFEKKGLVENREIYEVFLQKTISA